MSERVHQDEQCAAWPKLPLHIWLWCIWHTRPGHKPAGIILYRRNAFCAACGAEAPQ